MFKRRPSYDSHADPDASLQNKRLASTAPGGHSSTRKIKLTREDYSVGWICPLEVELTAALEMLDEEHESLPQPDTDHNVYGLGRIGDHNIVIAGLYRPGNNAAATVVTQMRTTFPALRFVLLVGIGGGVPTTTDNGMIHLGDVVVSKPSGEHSGAIQYDHGKSEAGHFRRTGSLAPPPAVLLSAAQSLASKRARSRYDTIVENIKRIDTDVPGLQRYRYPGRAQDRLFQSSYLHQNLWGSCKGGCDFSQLLRRDLVIDEEDDTPTVVVHRGTIAAGERVIKDARLRDRLARKYDILCFEMEAAGALSDFPCMVIRGISDYCDSHKNDIWHGFAAAAAAAYARELLFHVPLNEPREPALSQKLGDRLELHQEQQKRREIIDWLTQVDYGSQYSDLIRRRQDGTGQWLLASSKFKDWLRDKGQVLFCPGIPGAGKTMMTAIVIEYMFTDFDSENIGIAYLFCNFRRHYEQKVEGLLASILKQLVQRLSTLPECVKQLYEKHESRRTSPSFSELSSIISLVLNEYRRTFIFVDALDECEVSDSTRTMFLDQLFHFQQTSGVNVFATARFIPEIISEFEGRCQKLEIRAHDEDVRRYLDSHLAQLPHCVLRRKDLQEEIMETILDVVDGMFLLVQLHLDSLRDKTTISKVRTALKNLPKGSLEGLNRAYSEAMERIQAQMPGLRRLAERVLSWIVCSRRPLSTLELRHALAVSIGDSELDLENLEDVEEIVSVCVGLVAIDEESDIIRLVHYTAQEYFTKQRTQLFPLAEEDIRDTCATYISFDTFAFGPCITDEAFESRLQSHVLYRYASQNWGYYAQQSAAASHVVMEFVRNKEMVTASCQGFLASKRYLKDTNYSQRVPTHISGLHLACYFDLCDVLSLLLSSQANAKSRDSTGQTPLAWAAQYGHVGAARLLVEQHSINVNSKCNLGFTPLSISAQRGHGKMVELLATRDGVELESKDDHGRSPLSWAAANGHKEVVDILLATDGIDPNSIDGNGATTLWHAALNGHDAVVERLLTIGSIEVNRRDNTWLLTPLTIAVEHSKLAAAILLLADNRSDLDAKDVRGRTPLSYAAGNGLTKIMTMLLSSKRVDPDSRAKNNGTPLWYAARAGNVESMRILYSNYLVDLNVQDSEYLLTPLNVAVEWHRPFVAQFLISTNKAKLDLSDIRGRTPLSWAAEKGLTAIVELLINSNEVDVNSKCEKLRRTPLSYAIVHGHLDVVKILLRNKNIDLNCRDKRGRTPLSLAAERGQLVIMELLLSQDGIDTCSTDDDGRTPLSWAAENGQKEVIQSLLATRYLSPNTSEMKTGQTPLHYATRNGFEEIVRVLLTHEDVDVNCRDNVGRTPLFYAAASGLVSLVEAFLVTDSVNVSSRDYTGQTPLSWVLQHGPKEIEDLLHKATEESKSPHATLTLPNQPQTEESMMSASSTARSEELWSIWSTQREELITFSEDDMGLEPDPTAGENSEHEYCVPYLSTDPISVHHPSRQHPVRKVSFTINSKDQGWSSYLADHGTYENSWTWFEAVVRDDRNRTYHRPRFIIRNVHAGQEYKTHVIVWTVDDDDEEKRAWIQNLERGQRIELLVGARFKGWTNNVASARIDVFTALEP